MTGKKWVFWLGMGVLFLVFLYLIRAILLPFVLGIFVAYFLHPVADRLQKGGMSRTLAALSIILGFFAVLTILLLLIVPVVAGQLSGLIAALPEYVNDFEQQYASNLTAWLAVPQTHLQSMSAATSDASGVIVKLVGEFLTGALHSGMAAASALLLVLITPVVAFYLLRDWETLVARIDALLPHPAATVIRQQLAIIDRTLAGFVRGQFLVCLILATYYSVALSLAGLKFSIILGLSTGLLVIFPYVGVILAMITAIGMALFQFDTLMPVGMVLGIYLVGQAAEGYIITPRLVGERVGLHPVWIIFGMLSGAALFGFVGVLMAVPVTAIIGVLIRFATEEYLKSDYYQGKTAVRRT